MFEQDGIGIRCRAVTIALNQREQWGLTVQQLNVYIEQIIEQLLPDLLATQIEVAVRHFHADHAQVRTLRNQHSTDHIRAWGWVEREITRVIRFKNLAWSSDQSVELADLVQIAQAEVARSIGSYHYRSSLRTWLQSVTDRRIRRYHRDNAAAKRAAHLEPLEAAIEQPLLWGSFEPEIMASLLEAEIHRVLSTQGSERHAQIFRLRVINGLSAEQVGKQVKLHPSRVRTLLRHSQQLLQQDPGLRRWNDEGATSDSENDRQDRS